MLLFYIALQARDVIVQAVFLAQEIDLRHLLLGVEKEMHEAGQRAAVLLEFCLQVLLAGLRRRADTRFAGRLIFDGPAAAGEQDGPHTPDGIG